MNTIEKKEMEAVIQSLRLLLDMQAEMDYAEFHLELDRLRTGLARDSELSLGTEPLDQSQIKDYASFPADYRYFVDKIGLLGWSDGYKGPEMCQPFQFKELKNSFDDYLSGEAEFRDQETTDFLYELNFTVFSGSSNLPICDIAKEEGIADWYLLAASITHTTWLMLSTEHKPFQCMVSMGDVNDAKKCSFLDWLDRDLLEHLEKCYQPLPQLAAEINKSK